LMHERATRDALTGLPNRHAWSDALQVAIAQAHQQQLAVAVMFAAATLPVGANVFLFTQRYGVMQEEVSSSIAISTALAMLTLPLMLLLGQRLL